MGSMFRHIMQQKETEEKAETIMNVARADDPRYFICIEDSKMIACGEIDDIYQSLPEEYKFKKLKYHFYDPAREIVKVVF